MKRTLLALASLTAIILLSCNSIENSSSSADDLDFSQTPTLQKASPGVPLNALPDAQIQGSSNPGGQLTIDGTGSMCKLGVGSMKVTNVPYGTSTWSSESCFDFRTLANLYSNPKNIAYEFTCSVPTNAVGAFGITKARIDCGDWRLEGNWQGLGGIMATEAFQGLDADVVCCISFYGRCNGTGSGGVGCSYEMKNCNGCQWFSF